ncbi:hypothetical protein NMY22_g1517 [Coprinellus aureogranulatus]|nr:hypothetical protein NMY22_g1517 [Coprinellus aureogranulatus]
MDSFEIGSSVFFWTVEGEVVYGTVQSLVDQPETPLLNIKTMDGRELTLPAPGVTSFQAPEETRPQQPAAML